jgi:hypothetical protein
MTTAPRKHSWLRRLFRFSLVTFLVAIGILAGVFGWLRHRAEQQRLAVEWITGRGGEIRYTHYRQLKTNVYYSLGSDEDKAQRAALRPDNSWLADTLGEEYVHRIESVSFYQAPLDGESWRLAHAFGAQRMSFVDCDVSVEVLEALGNCSSLEEITISDCRCDAVGLGHLARLSKLRQLSLNYSKFGDGALEQISKCTNLESLDLHVCEFPAEDLRQLKALSGLTYIGLGFTSVGDRQLDVLKSFPKLQRLDLGEQVTDAGLDHLTQLMNLESLAFMKSQVTDEGIIKLIHLPKLKTVQFSGCRLSDEMIHRLYSEEPYWMVSHVR